MKNTMKINFLIILLASIYLLCSSLSVASEHTIENIDYTPKNPAPESTLTFTANIGGDEITSINLIVEECKDESFCFIGQNITMDYIDTGIYQAEVTLEHDTATIVKYHLLINNIRYPDSPTEDYKFDLVPSSNGDNNGDGSNGTPGFLFLFLLISIVVIILYVRKRAK